MKNHQHSFAILREMNLKDVLKLLPDTNEFQLEALTRDMRSMQGGRNKTAPECLVMKSVFRLYISFVTFH